MINNKLIKISAAILSVVLCFWSQDTFSQAENRFSIGPRLGVNFANINEDATSATRLVAGLTSTYSINKSSGITVDLLYSGEGYDRAGNEYRYDYLKIPILFNLFIGDLGDALRPKIYAGVAPGFLLSSEFNNSEVNSTYKSNVLDFVGGLGFNYRLANRVWLNADLRSYLGISDLTEAAKKVSNRTIQLSLGVAYGL
jgi:outer membrane protein W